MITDKKINDWRYLAVVAALAFGCVFLGVAWRDHRREIRLLKEQIEKGSVLGPEDQFIKDQNARYQIMIDSLQNQASHWKEQASLLEERIIQSQKITKRNDKKLRDDLARWRDLPNDERSDFIREELSKVDTLPGR